MRAVLATVSIVALLAVGCSVDGRDTVENALSGIESSEEGVASDGVGSELLIRINDLSYSTAAAIINPPPEYYHTLKECMNQQGFDYDVPSSPQSIIPQSELTDLLDEVTGLDPTSSSFRDRYGYGVTTISAYLEVSVTEDPQSEHLAELSEPELLAWMTAAYGEEFVEVNQRARSLPEDQLMEEGLYFEMGGCTKEADEAAAFSTDLLRQEDMELQEAVHRILASPGYVRIEQEWIRCVADQGHPQFTGVASVSASFSKRLQEIRTPDPFQGMTEDDVTSLSEEELQQLSELQQSIYEEGQIYDLEDLRELQQEELELAQQLEDCDIAYWTGFAELEDHGSVAQAGPRRTPR